MRSLVQSVHTVALLTLLRNVKDLRFFAALALVLTVTGVSAVLSEKQTGRRQREFQAQRDQFARTANLETVKLAMKPSPLSFLSDGGGDKLPTHLVVASGFLDQPLEEVTNRNPVRTFRPLDWVFIVSYFFSFLALALTFDFASQQRESGTLGLVLANPVPRLALFLGGFLGTMATLVPCLLAGLLIFTLPPALSGLWVFSWEGAMRIGLVALLSLLLLAIMALAGMFSSALFHHPGSSLTFAFLFWAALVLVVPLGGRIAGYLWRPVQSFADFRAEVGSARVRYLSELSAFSSTDIRDRVEAAGQDPAARERAAAAFQQEVEERNLRAIESFRRRVGRLRQAYLSRLAAREDFIRLLQSISPAELYRFAAEDLCGVGRNRFQRFWRDAQRYAETYTEFAQRERRRLRDEAKAEGALMTESGYSVKSVSWLDYNRVEFDRNRLPAFEDRAVPLRWAVGQALSKCLVLTIMLFALTLAAAWSFVRLEP